MAGLPSFSSLMARFPALRRLGLRRRPVVPWIQQMEAADCGAACMAMVVGYFGKDVSLREAREVTGAGRGGVSARDLVEAAERFRLRARGVRLSIEDLRFLPPASILHWGFDHFVVLEAVGPKGVRIVDPAGGRRLVSQERLREHFTGVALTFEPAEGFQRARRRRGDLLGYLGRLLAHRPVLIRAVVLSLLLQILGLALPLLLGALVDRVVPRGDTSLLSLLAVGMLAVVIFHVFTLLLRSYLLHYLRAVFDAQLNLGFVGHLAELPYGFFLERASGDLLARYESNQTVRQVLTSATLSTLLDGAMVGLYLLLLLVTSPPMGGLVVFLGLLQVGLFLLLRRPYHELVSRELEVQARARGHLVEMLAGMETLKSLGAERQSVERWSHLFVDELNVSLARGKLGSIVGSITSGLNVGSPLAVLVFGGFLVLRGDLSLGMMLTLNALAVGFLTPLSSLVATALTLQEVRSHIARIEDVLGSPMEQQADARPAPRLRGAIALQGVSFRYRRNDPWVLRDVSVEIAPGQKVAVVGRSGAGKSTLARLLVGLYAPASGRVLYDGVELASLDLHSVRTQIGVVTQDARVFGTSIRNNIALAAPRADLGAIIEAARQAEIHVEIEAMPMGYDTLLTDGGASLSGGQRQRLALARALVRRPAILLLDEATSDLDTITESRVTANLAAAPCTRIVIAHRLSTVADADQIFVLEDGVLVEAGTHRELLAKRGSYADLVAAQTGQP